MLSWNPLIEMALLVSPRTFQAARSAYFQRNQIGRCTLHVNLETMVWKSSLEIDHLDACEKESLARTHETQSQPRDPYFVSSTRRAAMSHRQITEEMDLEASPPPSSPRPASPPSPVETDGVEQRTWFSSDEVERVTVHKPSPYTSLGLAFIDPDDHPSLKNADGTSFCIIDSCRPGSISESFLQQGDRVVAIEGIPSQGPTPAATHLRSLSGDFTVDIVRGFLQARKDDGGGEEVGEPTRAITLPATTLAHATMLLDAKERDLGQSDDGEREEEEEDDEAEPSRAAQSDQGDDRVRSLSEASKSLSLADRPTGTRSPGSVSGSSGGASSAGVPPSPSTPGGFHLNLPASLQGVDSDGNLPLGDNARDPKIFGNKAHLRLGTAKGSAKDLLKAHGHRPSKSRGTEGSGGAARPLSARFRQLGSSAARNLIPRLDDLLTPRGSHA